MDLGGERVVAARHLDQFAQTRLERLVLVAQGLHLPLDERHRRGAAVMRKLEFGEQRCVALEEIRILLQIVGDDVF